MKEIRYTKSFKKSLKRIEKSGINKKWRASLEQIVGYLAGGEKLSSTCKDHSLSGDLKRYRECHVLHDMVLVYLSTETDLILVDIGSHSEIFG